MTFMSLVGRLTFGQMADFRDKRFVMAGAFALAAFSLLLFATVYEPWQVLYTLPVFALGFGGMIPTRPAFQAEYFGLRAFGAIQGLVFTIATLGALVGPVFALGIRPDGQLPPGLRPPGSGLLPGRPHGPQHPPPRIHAAAHREPAIGPASPTQPRLSRLGGRYYTAVSSYSISPALIRSRYQYPLSLTMRLSPFSKST
jgi:hypothetical protein